MRERVCVEKDGKTDAVETRSVRLLVLAGVLTANPAFAGVPVFVEALANQCRFEEALKVFEFTSGGLPRSEEEIALIRARLMLQLEKYDDALSASARVTASPELTLIRGLALAQLGRSDEALGVLSTALALGVDEGLVESGRAIAAMRSWNEPDAERVLLRVLEKDPSLSSALYNLACIRSSQGRLAESAELVRKAWAVGWRNIPRLRNDSDLEALRRSGLIGDLISSESPQCLTW